MFSAAYETLQFYFPCLPGPCLCTENFHWVSHFVLHINLGGFSTPVIQPQNRPTIIWGWWGPVTNPLPYIWGMLYNPILTYPMTTLMHTLIPCVLVLWPNLPQLETLLWHYYCLLLLLICDQHPTFPLNFGCWPSCTSVLVWDLELVYYCLL